MCIRDRVERGDAHFGVVPIENSLEGSISRAYDLMLESNLKVRGEIELRVIHCLIANPGARLDLVRRVYSHPQALGQCGMFLRHLDAQLIPTYDTAGSVKMIKERGITDGAAIASLRAAEIYGMEVLAHPYRLLLAENVPVTEQLHAWTVRCAAEHGFALEINSHKPFVECDLEMIRVAAEAGVPLAIGTDTHRWSEFGDFSYHVHILRKAGLSPEMWSQYLWRPSVPSREAAAG